MAGIDDLFKRAQEVQQKMAKMQEQLKDLRVSGSAGAGMVRVELDGKGSLVKAEIDPGLFDSEEKDVLEDLIVAAHNDAKARLEDRLQKEMADMGAGMDLPAGFKLPF